MIKHNIEGTPTTFRHTARNAEFWIGRDDCFIMDSNPLIGVIACDIHAMSDKPI